MCLECVFDGQRGARKTFGVCVCVFWDANLIASVMRV